MARFKIKWELEFYKNEDYPDETHIVEDIHESEDLQTLLKDLEENIENYTPELGVSTDHTGDLNMEYLSIKDENDNIIWPD